MDYAAGQKLSREEAKINQSFLCILHLIEALLRTVTCCPMHLHVILMFRSHESWNENRAHSFVSLLDSKREKKNLCNFSYRKNWRCKYFKCTLNPIVRLHFRLSHITFWQRKSAFLKYKNNYINIEPGAVFQTVKNVILRAEYYSITLYLSKGIHVI